MLSLLLGGLDSEGDKEIDAGAVATTPKKKKATPVSPFVFPLSSLSCSSEEVL